VSGSAVRVRVGNSEGWASTTDVLPPGILSVLDARTGAIVGSVPSDGALDRTVFSPDGTRAIVVSARDRADEYRMRDFAHTRSIQATNGAGAPARVVSVFYGGPAGAPYAVVDDSVDDLRRLAVVRIREPGEPQEPPVLVVNAQDVTISADGRRAFATSVERDVEAVPTSVELTAIDLRALATCGRFTLSGELAAAFDGLEASGDGTELYLLGDVSRLRVIDATTGRELRNLPTGIPPTEGAFLVRLRDGGDLWVAASSGPCDGVSVEGYWRYDRRALVPVAPSDVAWDDGRRAFGIWNDGRGVVEYGRDGRKTVLAVVHSPRLRTGYVGTPTGLLVSPDGSRILMLVAFGEEFCPC
jgi:hypothetical protein